MGLSAFPTAGELSSLGAHAPRWRPGLPREHWGATFSELFASGREGSGAAAALALALDGFGGEEERAVLWVQDAAALRLTGRPYRPGLPAALRRRVIHVVAPKAEDALFALEEAARCRDFAGAIGEIAGNPKALDFTASRRLALAAEKYGVPLFLVRLDAARELSAARMRWQVRAAPSPPPRWNGQAPGRAAWHAELFRARGYRPGEWILDDGAKLSARPSILRQAQDERGSGRAGEGREFPHIRSA